MTNDFDVWDGEARSSYLVGLTSLEALLEALGVASL